MFNFSDHLQELRSLIIGLGLLLATTILGLVWLSIGLYHYLSSYLGSTWGPVVLGLLLFVPMLVFVFVKAFGRSTQQSLQQTNLGYAEASALNISKTMESLAGHSPFFMTSVAIVTGILAARFPALLPVFMQVLSAYAEDAKARATKDAT